MPAAGSRARNRHYLAHKEAARTFIQQRAAVYAVNHGFEYNRIAVRNTKRSWGSCSELGNLNFHYRLYFLPREIADYIIVHELCHLRELNHSPRFWQLVADILPDYRERIRRLKQIERTPQWYRRRNLDSGLV